MYLETRLPFKVTTHVVPKYEQLKYPIVKQEKLLLLKSIIKK